MGPKSAFQRRDSLKNRAKSSIFEPVFNVAYLSPFTKSLTKPKKVVKCFILLHQSLCLGALFPLMRHARIRLHTRFNFKAWRSHPPWLKFRARTEHLDINSLFFNAFKENAQSRSITFLGCLWHLPRLFSQFPCYKPRTRWGKKITIARLNSVHFLKRLSHVCPAMVCCKPYWIMHSHSYLQPRYTYYVSCRMSVQSLKSPSLAIESQWKK